MGLVRYDIKHTLNPYPLWRFQMFTFNFSDLTASDINSISAELSKVIQRGGIGSEQYNNAIKLQQNLQYLLQYKAQQAK
jgi:hypothetical protein